MSLKNDGVIWRGPKNMVQQKLRWSFTAEGEELVVPFEGPLSVALASKPRPGMKLRGFTAGDLRVQRVDIEEGDGDSAKMVVTLAMPKAPDSDTSTESLGEPIFEVDFQELTKVLEQNRKCGKLKPGRPAVNGKKRTWDDWADLTEEDYDDSGGAWSLSVYKGLRAQGVESFSIAYPVIRRTLYFLRTPLYVGYGCYMRQAPPVGAPTSVGGELISYIKTTEKLRKEGRLRTLETEWIGANAFAAELYP